MTILRSVIFEVIRVLLTVIFSLTAFFTYPLSIRNRYKIICSWSKLMTILAHKICKIDYIVLGEENIKKGSVIVASKHQSAWETFAFQVIFPPQVWVLKKELLNIPFFGWGLRMLDPIAINRNSSFRALKEILIKGTKKINEGWYIIIFPEGTRVKPGEKLKYQSSFAVLAEKNNTNILPVALNSGSFWAKNSFIKKPGIITVKIGKQVETKNLSSQQITKKIESWIETESNKLQKNV